MANDDGWKIADDNLNPLPSNPGYLVLYRISSGGEYRVKNVPTHSPALKNNIDWTKLLMEGNMTQPAFQRVRELVERLGGHLRPEGAALPNAAETAALEARFGPIEPAQAATVTPPMTTPLPRQLIAPIGLPTSRRRGRPPKIKAAA